MDNRDHAAGGELAGKVLAEKAELDWSPMPVTQGSDDSVVLVVLRRLRHEPALLFPSAYLLISVLGLWCSYWFYRGFDLPILEYLQAGDFLVAGIKDPMYAILLLFGVLMVVLCSWPETLRLRNPGKVEQLRARNMWWRLLFSRSVFTSWQVTGLRPLTAMTLAVVACLAAGTASMFPAVPAIYGSTAVAMWSVSSSTASLHRRQERHVCSVPAVRSCFCGGRSSNAPRRCQLRRSSGCRRSPAHRVCRCPRRPTGSRRRVWRAEPAGLRAGRAGCRSSGARRFQEWSAC